MWRYKLPVFREHYKLNRELSGWDRLGIHGDLIIHAVINIFHTSGAMTPCPLGYECEW